MALLTVTVTYVYEWNNVQQPLHPGINSLTSWLLLLFDFDVLDVPDSNRALHTFQLLHRPTPRLLLIPRNPC